MKIYSDEVVENVRLLRSAGLTYREINDSLGMQIPKSTISYLCRDIDPGNGYRERMQLETTQRLAFVRELAKKKNNEIFENKLTALRSGVSNTDLLMQDIGVAKIALAMLYLGEGSKWKSRRGPALGSSDHRIIRTYLHLLYSCYGVQKPTVRCRIQHRADQDHAELLAYWQKVTELPESQFYKGYIDRRTIGKPTKKTDYRGVCTITCPGTYIQLELDIIADIINETWGISSVG